MNYKPERPGSSAASKSLKILETVARLGTGSTAKDITDTLQMPPATAYRLLNSLVGDEYLVRTSDLRGFALGHALSDFITAAAPPFVPTAAHSAIEDFRNGTRFAVHLILFRNAALKIADEDADRPLLSSREMVRYPHASAAGKLMLAGYSDITKALPKGKLARLTSRTITDREQLNQQLSAIQKQRFASDINELEEGNASLAIPVGLPDMPARAALCLSGPAERFTAISDQADDARLLARDLAPLLF
ncbi:helix-turn-helix domain-containing protein (plasmid) [Arthrobacter sp. TES]|uniref:IclR family transcriptional regulator n=1 Tax=Paenarthrobacter TaxID=1742992 RepID=UPI0003975E13|nr:MULTISPECIES: IclR family transcriptional regulator C-terminal domain-containing protein [Paenarthrobacter]ERI35631.1 IclR family transcriptional regulator [Arthrobacter sp. AK-YN10]MCY0975684.1 helix-turn-helix domain-containing protein [Paenarthrobacter ureafaciens]QOI65878.1 helix-turn-helix domain-containing protein [Arthrobacter sp. TES]WOC63368.1 IclR family transcriptional regulator C-terminal domain-containing protein [Paenarthrobacter sp. AT5]